MITATAHSEPIVQRKAARRPPRNIARYLARHAGPLPKGEATNTLLQGAHDRQAMRGADTPLERDAMRELLKIWGATRGYFPGKEMPVPRFGGKRDFDEGAVGYARNPQGDPVAAGVQFGRNTLEQLVRPQAQDDRDHALQTVLHEWAHNFQDPSMHRARDRTDPIREGGAEGFSVAVAPAVARALGQRYVGAGGLQGSEYRPFVQRLLRRHGTSYFTRGQFGG